MSSKLPSKVSNEVGCGVSELYQRFQCDYCQENIPGLRIKCGDCPDFDLCLECFACGAQIGKHKNTHKYIFMNNGGFSIFPRPSDFEDASSISGRRRKSLTTFMSNCQQNNEEDNKWNAREEMRLLDAVEQYGYGNWKDIANHIESKSHEQAKDEYIKHFIHGIVGKHTWKEELRGYAVDHTQIADRGPLSPTLTGKLPPISVSNQEALLLGYMPHRDDYEDFDKSTERLVSQIADKSVEDEDLDVALKLSQCDIYERRLREQVRRKRVARDYQLVSKFYKENPIVQIGIGKLSPTKISNQVKAVKKGDGPKQELIDALKPVTQFNTAQEFYQLIDNICVEKELKVRVKELKRYRSNGLKKISELVPFECERFKRELKHKRLAKLKSTGVPAPEFGTKFLPNFGDYSLKAILDPDYDEKSVNIVANPRAKKKPKKSKWSRKKEKTGRRLLIQQGCILTLASPPRRESTDA